MKAKRFCQILDDALEEVSKDETKRAKAQTISLIAGRRIQEQRLQLAQNIGVAKHGQSVALEFYSETPVKLQKK